MSRELEKIAHKSWECDCGHRHSTNINRLITGDNVLNYLPELIKGQLTDDGRALNPLTDRILLLADKNTAGLAFDQIAETCRELKFETDECILKSQSVLVPDEKAVFSLLEAVRTDTALIIAHGSGTINDIARFASYKLKIPYYIIATAPSMDGYASTVSPLIHNNMKKTYEARGAAAILAESKLLAASPAVMLAAGLGDLLGKFSAIADWRLSAIVTDEYYCPLIADMVLNTVISTLDSSTEIANRDPQAVAKIMDGLIMTGIAMSYAGNSRPASGSEHHLSHFWEMSFLDEGRPAVLHGSKVGLATILTCALYHNLCINTPDFSKARRRLMRLNDGDKVLWQQKMHDVYGRSADEVISLEESAGKNDPQKALVRLERIEKNWPEIVELILEIVPDPDVIMDALALNGGAVKPDELGISRELVSQALDNAKELRDRYTVLQLYWDLGISQQAAEIAYEVYGF